MVRSLVPRELTDADFERYNDRLALDEWSAVSDEVGKCTQRPGRINALGEGVVESVADFFGVARVKSKRSQRQQGVHRRELKRYFRKFVEGVF